MQRLIAKNADVSTAWSYCQRRQQQTDLSRNFRAASGCNLILKNDGSPYGRCIHKIILDFMRCNHYSRRHLQFITVSCSCANVFQQEVKIDCTAHPRCLRLCVCVWSRWVSNDNAKCCATSDCGRRQRRRHVRPYIRVGLAALSAFSGLPGVAIDHITATPSACRNSIERQWGMVPPGTSAGVAQRAADC